MRAQLLDKLATAPPTQTCRSLVTSMLARLEAYSDNSNIPRHLLPALLGDAE